MPIISATPIQSNTYRLTVTLGHGQIENVVVDSTGRYHIYYVADGQAINKTGRIVNIVKNELSPKNSYILFDWSGDNCSRKERIHFCQIQNIIDVTPNDAYKIALDHGFVGSVVDWLDSLKGDPGKDAYEIAVDCGFIGTREEWIESIKGEQGKRGYSAYQIAKRHGFEGDECEWLESLKGDSAYDIAVKYGFEGTEEEWLDSLKGASAYEIAVKYGFEGTEEEWLAQNGDTTELNQTVKKIVNNLEWKRKM